MQGEKIILPETSWGTAFSKAHQGQHPGINSLKEMHIWPLLVSSPKHFYWKSCCKMSSVPMFSNKTTKEPIQSVHTSNHPRNNVSVDLFGPMLTTKHVYILVQGIFTQFPAAWIVKSNSTDSVIKTTDGIYNNFGTPTSHRKLMGCHSTHNHSKSIWIHKGIKNNKVYPHHPQTNLVEIFMRPLGKAMKIAHYEHQNKENALNQLLASYQATPNIASSQAPGNLIFQNGYQNNLPHCQTTNFLPGW